MPSTHTNIRPAVTIDSIVCYEDTCNAPQSFKVTEISTSVYGTEFHLVSLSTGKASTTDLRQHGWTLVVA